MAYTPYDAGISRSMSRMSRRPSMQSMNYGTPYFPEQRQQCTLSPDTTCKHTGPHSYPLTRPISGQSASVSSLSAKGVYLVDNLAEAQMRGIRLSGSESYYLSDMHPNRYDNVYLKVRWPGHQECTYQLPLDSYDNGRLDLETLARRVARSCVHYFQNNRIPVSWDRMELKCLDELTFGVWEPQLTINHIL
ncbi:hypothetical protein CPB85DRAFT_1511062 [Mucidula mucida]|nr:hypothetical protein CPB85DRAFT_1511062 [Mucidula mucida]